MWQCCGEVVVHSQAIARQRTSTSYMAKPACMRRTRSVHTKRKNKSVLACKSATMADSSASEEITSVMIDTIEAPLLLRATGRRTGWHFSEIDEGSSDMSTPLVKLQRRLPLLQSTFAQYNEIC